MSVRFLPESSDFCGFCGAILPVPHNAPIDVSCVVCESVWLVKAKRNLLVCKSQKIYEATVASSDMGTVEEVENEVDHVCTRCGHGKATYSTMQTRSADEGQTVFYCCLKCKKKDIEYS